MIISMRRSLSIVGVAVLCAVSSATAQQITIGMPSVNVGDSFFESIGGGFNFGAAQGSSRNLSATAGSLTVTNGVPGFFAATTQRPFVTGLIPVVGDYGGGIAPVFGPAALMQPPTNRTSVVRERINRLNEGERASPSRSAVVGGSPNDREDARVAIDDDSNDRFRSRLAGARSSSAGSADLSVAEIRRRQAVGEKADDDKLAELRRKAAAAGTSGKPHVARIYQQQIDRRTGAADAARSATSGTSK